MLIKIIFLLISFNCLGFCEENIVQNSSNTNRTISPVIFVPGNGGSQLEAKLDKPSVVSYLCTKKRDYYDSFWLNLELLFPVYINCWIDDAKLYYDNVTRTTHNSPGVDIRLPGWGNPEVVEWIDPTQNKAGSYFKDIGNMLVSNLGYTRKVSLRGAPYDFRKAPNENKLWFLDMKKLIEDTYEQNNNTAVTLISHSMGSPMCLLLLQQMPLDWKNKYIYKWVSLAGAWAGSIKSVKVYAMGDDLDSFALSGKVMRAQQITMPSVSWLLPSPLFWKTSEVIVKTPNRNYTMSQLEQFLTDIDYKNGWEMRKDNIKYSLNFSPPDVELHCIYGSNIKTVEQLIYKQDNIYGETPSLLKGDGDGTVNARSLQACNFWSDLQKPTIKSVVLPGVDHMKILSNDKAIEYIKNLLQIV